MKAYFDIPDKRQTIEVTYEDNVTDLAEQNVKTKEAISKMMNSKVRCISRKEYIKLTKKYTA